MRVSWCLLLSALAVVAGCNLLVGADEFELGASGMPTGGGGSVGGSGSGGVGQGGSVPGATLADAGLIVRYYIDEASSGTSPSVLNDAAAEEPLPLQLWYQDAIPEELVFDEVAEQRALRWMQSANHARASVAIGDGKIFRDLHGSTTGTVEVVADVRGVTDLGSRISHIGCDRESGRFTLSTRSMGELQLYIWVNDASAMIGDWDIDLDSRRRTVLHVVFDSTQATAADRVRLYADGQPIGGNAGVEVMQHQTLDLGQGCHYALGNREVGERSLRGWLYYAALYSTALSDAAVVHNAAVLELDDDRP